MTQIDELARIDLSELPPGTYVFRDHDVEPPDGDDKTVSTLLDLLDEVHDQAWTVGMLLDACPDYDADIYRALLALLDEGAIQLET